MTIKDIKNEWSNKGMIQGCSGKIQFTTYSFSGFGKCVIVVTNEGGYFGRTVVACVQVSTGKDLFGGEHSRPCDNMDDAVDVADEILTSMISDGEIVSYMTWKEYSELANNAERRKNNDT